LIRPSGADGWQVSTSPILLLALFKASMAIFDDAGGIDTLRKKRCFNGLFGVFNQ
jgi:kynureninase